MICAAPITRGPLKGLPATGTEAGYTRHRRAGEPPCGDCRNGANQTRYQWAADHPTSVKAINRRFYDSNQEAQRAAARAWRAANPDKVRQTHRDWRRANPLADRARGHRRRTRQRQTLTILYSPDQLAQRMAYWGYRCWMCGGPFESVDHVKPISQGGPDCLANLRPACQSCNARKGSRWPIARTRPGDAA